MAWFETYSNWRTRALHNTHEWAQRAFPRSFATQGAASVAFAPTAQESLKGIFRTRVPENSRVFIQRLEKMHHQNPNSPAIKSALNKAYGANAAGRVGSGVMGRMFGGALGAGFVAMPFFTTEGGLNEKARATASGAAGLGGFIGGAKVGLGVGAAVGSVVPGLGNAVGAGVGWLVGGLLGSIAAEEGTRGIMSLTDGLVERERSRRKLNWVHSTAAFDTQKAHTMRQMSLQAMNTGQATARSILGRESIFIHR
jgi:hypothetical protein